MSHEVRSIAPDPVAHAPEPNAATPAPGAPEPNAAPEPGAPAADSSVGRLEPFEVFRQEKEGGPMVHGGSVLAPDPELAVHYARELYGRRQESVRLWVVRRTEIRELDDPDLLNPPLDRSFKKPGGYVMRAKLAEARERVGTEKPKARSASHDTTGRRTREGAGAGEESR